MWTVVLDTTAIVGDYRLRSPAAAALLERAAQGQLRIVVPEIVIREAVGRYRRDLDDLARHSAKQRTLAHRLGVTIEPADIDTDACAHSYEKDLRAALHQAGARTPPPSDVPHLDLVDRAIARQAPFRENGTGYRDALIWDTVRTEAATADVAFVTDNHTDFAESQEAVSLVTQSLRADLWRMGEKDDRVVVLRTPRAAIDYLFTRNEALLAQLQSRPPVDGDKLVDTLDPLIPVPDGIAADLDLPTGAYNVWVVAVMTYANEDDPSKPQPVRVTNAYYAAENHALVEFVTTVSARVEFLLSEPDLATHPGPLRGFSVLEEAESPSPEPVLLCVANRDLDLAFLATFDTEQDAVTDCLYARMAVS
ncbi:MAG: DUF4935 domain-containing protein [Acidimicrobiales bacterium]|nr:DUF4935 domain-containing protein [Acidimicrobiales bacterium]